MPHLVHERLYFGDIKDAIAALTDSSSTLTFTHVLSVVSSASISLITDCRPGLAIPTEEVRRVVAGEEGALVPPGTLMRVVERAGDGLRVTRIAVPLRDTEEENLLDHLQPCLEFVHCFAGVSRSASIIVAYLMKSEKKSLEEALESLKEINEMACPNDGFLDQLKLFEEMGFKVDTSSPLYKRFHLKLLGQSYKFGLKIGSYMFEDDPGLSPIPGSCQDPSKTEQHKTEKKCRRVIAVEDNVISHVPGEGESCFDWNRRKSGRSYSDKEQDCSSLFIEPLKWMTPGQSYKSGEKIGSYMFEDDPGLSPIPGSCQDPSKTEQHKTAYRCKKCRRVVAAEENVISHVPGEGESCFDWNRRKSGRSYSDKEQDCSSLFIEPLKWMTPEGALEGNIIHPLQGSVRILQLVRNTVQLWHLGYPCLPNQ